MDAQILYLRRHDDGKTWAVPLRNPADTPLCTAASAPGQRLVLDGPFATDLIGPFLVTGSNFGANGATPVTILRLSDGHQLYDDSWYFNAQDTAYAPIVTLGDGVLDIRYRRVVNAAPCSILVGRDACWRAVIRERHLPREIAARPAPTAACQAGLHDPARLSFPGDATANSVIAYDVRMTLTLDGKASILSRGPVLCWPSE